ncbi:MAG TPA: efflux RND transporter permease subunit [bacterium]|nr:efflux RND transporter permease subunit [bacterium]
MTLSDLSIKKPVFAWMLMFALIIFGAISFNRMGISQLPDVDFPVVTINLTDPGSSPETMETNVVDPVEGAVLQVEGVQDVTSQSLEGQATVTVTFALGRNIDSALVDVENAVVGVQKQLPTDLQPAQYSKTNPDDNPIMWLALTSSDPQKATLRDLMIETNDVLQDQFASVDGVGQVRQGGYLAPELRVWLDGKALRRYQLTSTDVINTIGNEHVELPSGLLENSGAKDANVRTLAQADSTKNFGDIYVNLRGSTPNYHPIPLKNVARIEEGLADVLRISRSDGKPAVGLGIVKQRGTNAVEVADAVRKKIIELNKTLPEGMKLDVRFDSTQFIKDAVHDLDKNLILAGLATALVCWLFLGSWSATFNVLLAIPTSIIGTFIILYAAGYTLNTFTLLGLSLSIGIVVDDAIMVLENIIRHGEMGKGKILAAMDGAKQITPAAVATSLAIVAIFLPIAFTSGVIGRYLAQFGVTMVAAVALSLLEALTLTPMRCSEFVHVDERTSWLGKAVEGAFHSTAEAYKRALGVALRHRALVILGALVFFTGSLFISKLLRSEFVPSQDMSTFIINFKTPTGSSMDFTDDKMKQVEAFLKTQPDILGVYDGIGGQYGGQLNSAFAFVTMQPKGQRPVDPTAGHPLTQAEEINVCRAALNKIPGMQAFVQDISTRGFTSTKGFPVEAGVRGPDWATLADSGLKLKQAMSDSGYMVDVDTDYQFGMPEVDVVPNRLAASQRGVSVGTIAEEINAMVGGVYSGYYPRSGHEDQIEVRLQADQRTQEAQINDLYVRNNRGEVVPLRDVVTLNKVSALQQITRDQRQRTITLYANVAPGKSQADALAKMKELADKTLPKGYHLVFNAGSTVFTDSMHDMLFALGLGIIVAYMVLASQFNSFVDPLTVLMALPFSASGALIALWLAHQSLNIYSMIGLILLMGIVKKNSIMLVDFTNEVRSEKKLPVNEALLEACPVRYRPILMTSVAVIAAAIPEALSHGAGSETQVPMAVVLIGGVLVSTVLTLFAVPCFYSWASQFESKHEHEDRVALAMEEAKLHPGHPAHKPGLVQRLKAQLKPKKKARA